MTIKNLPIESHRDEIVESVFSNPVTIVVGETGSGKTTQVPQFLFNAGLADDGMIGITEPRRPAVTSTARFVGEQLAPRHGNVVGYQVRHNRAVGPSTKVKFMTDGILLREFQDDPELSRYSVIMIDEAHERSQNIDFALGLLKDLLKRRPELRVVVASATIDAEKFSAYFDGAPVVNVSGRMYPVEIKYHPYPIRMYDDFGRQTMGQMVAEAVDKVKQIHHSGVDGDILVFMTGRNDVNDVCKRLKKVSGLMAIPVWGGMSTEEQDKIFAPCCGRKVVVATNVAETSITIDGIVYVVDSGLVKETSFHPMTGIQSLDTVPHSKAGCDQRSGRAGRTQPGVCYRLYTKEDFNDRPEYTKPEILRASIADVVLTMEDIGIKDVMNFDFLDSPSRAVFEEAYQTLTVLGAIGQTGGITNIGRRMAALPLEPRSARMLLEAEQYGCVEEVATIAAFLSAQNVFVRPQEKQWEADEAHKQFKDDRSDLLTLLNVWGCYVRSRFNRGWCYNNFLNGKVLDEVHNVRSQLLEILSNKGIEATSSDDDDAVLKSVTAGLIHDLLLKDGSFGFKIIFQNHIYDRAFVFPGSGLFSSSSRAMFMVSTKLVRTSKLFAHNCTFVPPEWVEELLPHYFRREKGPVSRAGDKFIQTSRLYFQGSLVGEVQESLSIEEARQYEREFVRQKLQQRNHRIVRFIAERGRVGGGYSSSTPLWETSEGLMRCYSYDLRSGDVCICSDYPSFGRYDQPVLEVRAKLLFPDDHEMSRTKSEPSKKHDASPATVKKVREEPPAPPVDDPIAALKQGLGGWQVG